MSKDIEKRFFDGLEVRMAGDGKSRVIEGYGIVFNKRFHLYGEFHEEIAPESGDYFRSDSAKMKDKRDTISAYNHNFEKVLGRVSANTLRFEVDEIGVKYIVDVPPTSYGDDLLVSIGRGDIKGSSFVFRVGKYEVMEENDLTIRRITEFDVVAEMGPVTNPAYTDTTVAKRSLDNFKKEKEAVTVVKRSTYKSRTNSARVAYCKMLLNLNK